MNTWFKLSELVESTNIPYQSLARYVKRHSEHLIIKKEHKSYLLRDDSVPVIEKIRKYYEHGLNEKEVEKELTLSGIAITVEMDGENDLETVGKIMQSMQEAIIGLSQKLENQEKFNVELLKHLEGQQKLNETLQESLEAQKQIAATTKSHKKWWKFKS